MCECQELRLFPTSRSWSGWSMKSHFGNTLFILLSLQVLTLAEIYKIPLRRFDRQVDFAVSDFTSQEDNLHGKPGQGYYIEMQMGTPPQTLNVLVDTGSSNFAVAAAPHPDVDIYFDTESSSTFEDLGTRVYVPYTQGNWDGHLSEDVVSITSLPDVAVTSNIACITSSSNFFINGSHWQGILGMAYQDIARPDSSIEPFFDSLIRQSDVNDTFSMQLCGTVDTSEATDVSMGGTMIFGGIDESRYQGDIQYAFINKEWYYEVILTDIVVAGTSLGLDCKEYNFDKTIVDSGTTNFRLPTKVFNKLRNAVQRQTVLPSQQPPPGFWTGENVLCWPEGAIPWELFPTITLTLAESHNTTFDIEISPTQYLRAVGDDYDPTEEDDCFKFAVASSTTGTVLGAVVMEGFYVIFDRENRRMGFAETTCTNRDSSAPSSSVGSPYHWDGAGACAYVKPTNNQSTLMIVAYIMAGICGLCMLPVVLMLLHWQYRQCRHRYQRSQEDPLFRDQDH